MLDVHEIFHLFFSAKYCNDRASQTSIPFLDPEMLELLEQAIKLGTPSLLPHLQRYIRCYQRFPYVSCSNIFKQSEILPTAKVGIATLAHS